MNTTDTTGDAVRRYLEIMNKLDVEALNDLFADDVVVRLPYAPDPVPKRTEGRENAVALYSGFPQLITPPGFHDEVIWALEEPGEFVAEYRSDCTMLSTGKPYRNDYIARFSVRDGRLTQVAEWFDPIVFLQAQEP
ncbi:nuclear transport factor 2 family protein [Pseudonocardia endophytica]|uniref:Ketosteroid isomerase-like protein n=1 Tax=Pseudonocardia endophytica TaxID=401976 RepID=A0A4R1HMY4_PSEEN|nr:nuclear transport factor 2 family protein [Pseudonocardia endophytica]TCK22423.1 ketosteroid isomerase-like protein [Pseudonocardia endophytica]